MTRHAIIPTLFLFIVFVLFAGPAMAGTPGYTFSGCPVELDLTAVDTGYGTWCPDLELFVGQVSLGVQCNLFATPVNINLGSSHPDLCTSADIALRVLSGESVAVDSVGRFGVSIKGYLIFGATEVTEFRQ